MSSSQAPILYVFSGAGLSAESGVATFRSKGGIWDTNNILRVCNYLTWKDNRTEVFEFYQDRRAEVAHVRPNAAHLRLAQWQAEWGVERVRLLTQNVDDLLEAAGAQEVIHLHGNLRELHCTACSTRFLPAEGGYNEHTRCPKCSSLKGVKPGVVFFHEAAPEYVHLKRLYRNIREQDVLLVIGTALTVVSPERLIPLERFGHTNNWQVNPEPDRREWFGLNLSVGAGEGLEQLETRVRQCLG